MTNDPTISQRIASFGTGRAHRRSGGLAQTLKRQAQRAAEIAKVLGMTREELTGIRAKNWRKERRRRLEPARPITGPARPLLDRGGRLDGSGARCGSSPANLRFQRAPEAKSLAREPSSTASATADEERQRLHRQHHREQVDLAHSLPVGRVQEDRAGHQQAGDHRLPERREVARPCGRRPWRCARTAGGP